MHRGAGAVHPGSIAGPMRRTVPSPGVRVVAVLCALLCLGLGPSVARAQDPAPGAGAAPTVDPTPDPWRIGDDIALRLESRWSATRGLYTNARGLPDTRLNSLMLQLHSMAALAGHQGAIRRDERIEPMVRVLTAPPVLVARSLRPRDTGHFPHAPAWSALIGENPEQARLHPSIDTAVVRALTAAWRARGVVGMAPETPARIAAVLVELAASPFYRGDSRALNQINWQTEVYAAALEVAGDTSVLDDYRSQLSWFAAYAHKTDPQYKGGSSNLTSGGGFRYLPNRGRSAQLNQVETTEYGNLALSALGMYQAAIRAGMAPLAERDVEVLRTWSRHMLLGSWTHAGYPNWDTGLGTKRRHLRQYWAWALDGLMTASGPDALLGYPKQRAYARSIASHGVALFLATAWAPTAGLADGPLPAKTSFGAPNGFSSGAGHELIAPLRFAILDASLDGRFQDVADAVPPNWYAHDRETGRFAFSTPRYNGAILPSRGGQAQGGIEPVRLFDGEQHPLTSLGGRGTGTLGLTIVKDGRTRLDTEPAAPGTQSTRDVQLAGKRADTASSFGSPAEVRARATSSVGRVEVRHRFSTEGIVSTYRATKIEKGARVALRVPVWGQDASLQITRGAVRKGNRWLTTTRQLRVTAKTSEGGRFTASLRGLPKAAQISISTVRPDSYRPRGAKQLVVIFPRPKSGSARIVRTLEVAPTP